MNHTEQMTAALSKLCKVTCLTLLASSHFPNSAFAEEKVKDTPASLTEKADEMLFPGVKTDFKGYDMYDLKVENKSFKIIAPKKAAPGKPWLWRSLFWTALPKVWRADLKLVEEGYHIVLAFGDVSGHPRGNDTIDTAYKYVVSEHGFAKQCNMASFSRGTLSLFRWAHSNPEKVASIYVDNGVCNIRSWPAGKVVPGNENSIAPGAPKSWALFKKSFGYTTDAEALASKESPIDLLAPLAEAKVPILMVSGLKDVAVPHAENDAIMIQRYEKLGGHIELILEENKGHTHGMKDPSGILAFIRKHPSE